MPTITGALDFPDDTTPMVGTWYVDIASVTGIPGVAIDADGSARAGTQPFDTDAQGNASFTLPAGYYNLTFESAAGSPVSGRRYKLKRTGFNLTANATVGQILDAPGGSPLVPSEYDELDQRVSAIEQGGGGSNGGSAASSTEVMNWADLPGKWLSPKRFADEQQRTTTELNAMDTRYGGAKGDGVTVDRPAIQTAINTASNFGIRRVVLPGRRFVLDQPLIPRSGVELLGAPGAVLTGNTSVAIGQPTSDLADFTVRGITFEGKTLDRDIPKWRGNSDRASAAGFTTAVSMKGSDYNGVVAGDTNNYPVIRNVKLLDCRFISISHLPFLFAGCRSVAVESSYFRNCMDPGFVYCDVVRFNNNETVNGADNGVSISRRCRNAIVAGNTFTGCAYNGIWVAGYVADVDGGLNDPGPEYVTVTGNIVRNCGADAIAMSDAPRYVTITANILEGCGGGAAESPSNNDGSAFTITGWPLASNTPTLWASQIVIRGNITKNMRRNFVSVRGAMDVFIDGNMVVDIGSATFVADDPSLGITAGSPVTSGSTSFNCGIMTSQPENLLRISVTNNRFVDTRSTPVMNYAITPAVRGSSGFNESGNIVVNLRQALGQTRWKFGEDSGTGVDLFLSSAGSTAKRLVYQTLGNNRFALGLASDGAFALERFNDDGSFLSRVWSVDRATALMTFNHSLLIKGGINFPVSPDPGVAIGTATTQRFAFWGATPVTRPSGTPAAATDAATTQALVNDLRSKLIILGLIA